MTPAVLAGLALGVGMALVIAGMTSPAPNLRLAVRRATATPMGRQHHASDSQVRSLIASLAERLGLDRHAADLRLVGSTPARMAAEKLGYTLLGVTFPFLLTSALFLLGMSVPFVVPALVGVVLGLGLSMVPDVDLARRARLARTRMRRTVCVYVELVALERAADAGVVEALERAAAVGSGPGFDHVREALLRARLEGRTPWQQLASLSEELRVPELSDLADIMRLSGEDGAAVLPTLRARAASLRGQLLQADVAAANEASERMSIPVALLALAFMVLLGFPALSRILFG